MNHPHHNNSVSRLILVLLFGAIAGGLALAPAQASEQIENPNAPVKSELREHGQGALPAQPRQVPGPLAAQPGQVNLGAQPGQVKKEEAEEDNVYRHTTLVASISDTVFHDNPRATDPESVARRADHIEITARTFEWVNTIIILFAIVLPVARIVPKVLRKRSQNLRHDLEQAQKTTADANARLGAVEAQLARLDEEIAKIRAHVEEESKQDEARIKASIEEESARIVASAEQEIAAAAAHAQRGLKAFAADLAIEQAAKQLILTPETDRELIAEFVASATSDGNGSTGRTGGRS